MDAMSGAKTKRKRLGEILVEAQLIDEDILSRVLEEHTRTGVRLGSLLVHRGFVGEEDLLRCLSLQLQLDWVDFRQTQIDPLALKLVPGELAIHYGVMPVATEHSFGKRTLVLAMVDPTDLELLRDLQFRLNLPVRPVVATESSILRAIDDHYFARASHEVRRYRLHGQAAVDYAQEDGGPLFSYHRDPRQKGREVSLEEARALLVTRPHWVYLDVVLCESCLIAGALRSAAPGAAGSDVLLCEACGAP